MSIDGEKLLYERIVMLEAEYNKERDRADKAAEWSENVMAAIYAYMRQATYPSWAAGDCRLCKYDETGLNGHAAGCPYADAYAALVALVGDPFDENNLSA